MKKALTILTAGVFAASCSSAALAGNLSYQGQNGAIFAGASPLGNAALMASVNRPKDPNRNTGIGQLDPAAIVQQGILSQVSNRIYTQIFDNSNNGGSFDLGNGSSVTYDRVSMPGTLIITIHDPIHGTTVISLPDV